MGRERKKTKPQPPLIAERAKPRWWIGLLLVALTIAAYIPTVSAGYIWDDDYHVHRNLALRSFDGLGRIWFHIGEVPQYYPLTHTTFWIEYQLWGNAPTGYHITNVLLHVASVVILWRLLARLKVPAAPFIASLFAVHPVGVESVAWVTERKNVLSGFFYLLSATMYWRAIGEPDVAHEPRFRWKFYAAAVLFFICALLSKTVASTLPAAMLLILWWKRGRLRVIDFATALPLLAFGAAFGSLTSWMERNVVGAFGPDWNFTFFDRILIAGRALCFYVGKLVWPVHLTFVYPRWNISPAQWWQWLYPAAVIAAVLSLFLARPKIGRGAVTAVLFFCGTLTPALGFFDVFPMRYSFVADHFQYLASIGIFALVCGGVATWVPNWRKFAASAGVCIVLLMAALTFRQARVYETPSALWLDTLAKNPDAWMASGNLGVIYLNEAESLPPDQQKARAEEARKLLERACQEKSNSPIEMVSLGSALSLAGDEALAVELWNRVMDMQGKTNPRAWPIAAADAQYQLGRHYYKAGDLEQAAAHFQKALEINPEHADAAIQLASILTAAGRLDEAWALFQKAARENPDSVSLWTNLGNFHLRVGNPREALTVFDRAIALEPRHLPAHYGRAISLASSGQSGPAETELRQLLREDPNSAAALSSLGTILLKTGRMDEARAFFARALEIQPNHPQAQRGMQQIEGAVKASP